MGLSRDYRPPPPGPRRDFVTIRSTIPTPYIVLSTRIWAHDIHYSGGRSNICTADKGSCKFCDEKEPTRWKGYLHALPYQGGSDCFLCLTPKCGYELMYGQEIAYNFRGKKLYLWRSGKNPKSLLLWRWDDNYHEKPELMEELDPKPFLEVLFRKKPGSNGQA